MSYFVIIRGPLGVGKSTIAKKLASYFDGEYVDIDNILKKNGLDIIDKNEGCIPVLNFIKADQLVLSDLKNSLDKGKIVIFDACFYHKGHIKDLIKNLPFQHYAFTLKAPVEICIKRDSERNLSYGDGAVMAVHNLVSKFDYGTIINTDNKTSDETFEEITTHLPNLTP